MSSAVNWKVLYELIAQCSQVHTPKGLAATIVEDIEPVCPYDRALVYFFNGNGRVCDQYLKRVSDHYSVQYLSYYVYADNGQYSCYKEYREGDGHPIVKVFSWDQQISNEFIPDFIRPNGLKHSAAFVLYDLNGNYRAFISLDRTREQPFRKSELEQLRLLVPVLNHIHKNFFYEEFQQEEIYSKTWQEGQLTKRETEIANLLCQGVSPANISRTLYIAPKTTYHHISNIYKKLHVSSKQELLVRLLRS
ncbi:MAG: hypothetical protein HFF62_13590 [Oscillospiraceae bacterium]|nr:hypothetical protein [Oscillospiraceae bacterium]